MTHSELGRAVSMASIAQHLHPDCTVQSMQGGGEAESQFGRAVWICGAHILSCTHPPRARLSSAQAALHILAGSLDSRQAQHITR